VHSCVIDLLQVTAQVGPTLKAYIQSETHMNSTNVIASKAEQRSTPTLLQVLANPWLDRTIAAIACVPFAYYSYYRYRQIGNAVPLVSLWIQSLLLIIPMVSRRPPKRITPNPTYWLLAFVASYWLLMPSLAGPGRSLVSAGVANALAFSSLIIAVWARLSLGRNIGFVPAQRDLVAHWAYHYVRHPIYTGVFMSYLAFALAVYSPRNLLIAGLGILWFVVKSFVEEDFLRMDPQYAAYMQKVRARWIPFVL
jgi:protein-S-isoprenylcysteine O-methyltransferase Ste14